MKIKFETVIDTESMGETEELFEKIARNIAKSTRINLMDKDAHEQIIHYIEESFVYGGLKQLATEWVTRDESESVIAMRVMNRSIVEGKECSM
jgi:sulfur relay (sulfurtransferase) DsrC/TusE family protein